MSGDEKPKIKKPRPIRKADLPEGPRRDLRDSFYHLYTAIGQPSLTDIVTHYAELEDELDVAAPGRDTISEIIAGRGKKLQPLHTVIDLARVLAHLAGDNVAKVAVNVERLWREVKIAESLPTQDAADPAIQVSRETRDDLRILRIVDIGREVTWPVLSGSWPTLADVFQPREDLRLLPEGYKDSGTLVYVLQGMPGVGKTQLAAEVVWRLWQSESVDLVAWISATTSANIVGGYASAARSAGLEVGQNDSEAARRFQAWLASTKKRWLLVLDNLVQPEDIQGWWPPPADTGRTIVTTRRIDHALENAGREVITITPFTQVESETYMHQKLLRRRLADDITRVTSALGHLPIALSHAAAFMIDEGISCTDYLQRLDDRSQQLTKLFPTGPLPDDYPYTIEATISLSLETANKQGGKLPGQTFTLTSLLDPSRIPGSLLQSRPVRTWFSKARRKKISNSDIRQALRILHRYSLLTHDPQSPLERVQVHELIQRVHRERQSAKDLDAAAVAAALALIEIWPDVETFADIGQVLRDNATALIKNRPKPIWQHDETRVLLFQIGRSLRKARLYEAAVEYGLRLVAEAHERLGPEHPDTLSARSNLAVAQAEAGDPESAALALAELEADCRQILGPKHRDTIAVWNNVLFWKEKLGRPPSELIPQWESLLSEMTEADWLYPDDPLKARLNATNLRGTDGDLDRCVADLQVLTEDATSILGVDHPIALTIERSYAYWLEVKGEYRRSAEATEHLAHKLLVHYGPSATETLSNLYDLATRRAGAGDLRGAVDATSQLVAALEGHPAHDPGFVFLLRVNIAYWAVAGETALTALKELLRDAQETFGPEHNVTWATRVAMAHCTHESGDPESAIRLLQDLREDAELRHGPDHHQTHELRHAIAKSTAKAGRTNEAVLQLEELIPDRSLAQSESAHDTDIRTTLAWSRGEAGDTCQAIEDFGELLAEESAKHPARRLRILKLRAARAYWIEVGGDHHAAAAELKSVLEERIEIYHPQDLESLAIRERLSALLSHQRGSADPIHGS